MIDIEMHSYLAKIHQMHLLEGWEGLSDLEKLQFWDQIRQYEPFFQYQNIQLTNAKSCVESKSRVFEPAANGDIAGSVSDLQAGELAIAQGKVACLILAGGQGSRLGMSGPKGCVIVAVKDKKSLFQIFCESIAAQSKKNGVPLHVAIMTSPLNHQQTIDFFQEHDFFGLSQNHLIFFQQDMLPITDHQGNWLLEKPGQLAEGPNGNGKALHLLYQRGIVEQWRLKGVEYVNVILVDNPLADPFDAELIGYQMRMQTDVVIKSVLRDSVDEKMGLIVQENKKLRIIEYSEMPDHLFRSVNLDGTIRFIVANAGLFSFSMRYIEKIAVDPLCQLPLHQADKQIELQHKKVSIYKYETFLFDVLDYTDSIGLLIYPRQLIYAPIKTESDLVNHPLASD